MGKRYKLNLFKSLQIHHYIKLSFFDKKMNESETWLNFNNAMGIYS